MNKYSDQDKHFFDPFLKMLGSRYTIILFALISFITGFTLSLCKDNWEWVARFGSLITVAGLLLSMSPIFIMGIYISQSQVARLGGLDSSGKTKVTSSEDRKIGGNVIVGVFISLIGTVLWGFGDIFFD